MDLITFLIDKKGKILKIWENVKVKDHAKEVLDTLLNILKKHTLLFLYFPGIKESHVLIRPPSKKRYKFKKESKKIENYCFK